MHGPQKHPNPLVGRPQHPDNPQDHDIFYCFVVRALRGLVSETTYWKTNDRSGEELFTDDTKRELGLYVPKGKTSVSGVRYHSLQANLGDKLFRHREFVVYNAQRTNIRYLVAYRRM